MIETVAMTAESILADDGLPHSEDMRVVERLSLASRDGAQWLVDDITITDPAIYEVPVKVTQRFRRAEGAEMSDGRQVVARLLLKDDARIAAVEFGRGVEEEATERR